MKKVFALILALAMSMSLFACGQSGSKDDGQKKFKVSINLWGQANFFARAGKEAMEDELTKLGCEIIPTVTDNTPDRMKAIENATAMGVDAIIVQEGDITEAETAVLEAKQKGIIIGHKGEKLKRVGQTAREDMEQFLGKKVFLQLFVKVSEDWRNNDRLLRRFGYELE